MPEEQEQDWYFTFGASHAHPFGYVKVHGTFSSARDRIQAEYGRKWAMQYTAEEFAPQPARYGLHEVQLGD